MRNREFVFTPKIEYELVAESLLRRDKLREANQNRLQFPTWCSGGDSNSQALRHTALNRTCLPISPPEHILKLFRII